MNWLGFVLVAAAVLVGSRLLKLLPHGYQTEGAVVALALTFLVVPALMRRGRHVANRAAGLAVPSAQVVLDQPGVAHLLYLRPFESDGQAPNDGAMHRNLFDAYGMPEDSHEVTLVASLGAVAPVVAIGRPASDAVSQLGALRYYVPAGGDWQIQVAKLLASAKAVIVRLDRISPGVAWELQQVAAQRGFRSTAVLLAPAGERTKVYARLKHFLPGAVAEQLPDGHEDIVAIYVDSAGACHLLRQTMAMRMGLTQSSIEQLTRLVREDLADAVKVSEMAQQAFSGVRCWHRKGIGMTPRNSYVGKVIVSPTGLRFLSSGKSLVREILAQRSPLAAASATIELDEQAMANPGSLFVEHARLDEMTVRGSALQSLHIRIEYRDHGGKTRHCALAMDGAAANSADSLNALVRAYINARSSMVA